MPANPEPPALLPDGEPPVSPWRVASPWRAFRHASDGILYATLTQRNMLIHLLAFATILALALGLHVGPTGLIALCFAGTLVVLSEMLNTAVEAIVDLVTPHYHPLARVAKDVGAGATFVAALNAVVVGVVVFGWMVPPGTFGAGLPLDRDALGIVPAVALLPLLGLLVYRTLRYLRRFKSNQAVGTAIKEVSTADNPPTAPRSGTRPAAPQR